MGWMKSYSNLLAIVVLHNGILGLDVSTNPNIITTRFLWKPQKKPWQIPSPIRIPHLRLSATWHLRERTLTDSNIITSYQGFKKHMYFMVRPLYRFFQLLVIHLHSYISYIVILTSY